MGGSKSNASVGAGGGGTALAAAPPEDLGYRLPSSGPQTREFVDFENTRNELSRLLESNTGLGANTLITRLGTRGFQSSSRPVTPSLQETARQPGHMIGSAQDFTPIRLTTAYLLDRNRVAIHRQTERGSRGVRNTTEEWSMYERRES